MRSAEVNTVIVSSTLEVLGLVTLLTIRFTAVDAAMLCEMDMTAVDAVEVPHVTVVPTESSQITWLAVAWFME
jgi:hypothetical protein